MQKIAIFHRSRKQLTDTQHTNTAQPRTPCGTAEGYPPLRYAKFSLHPSFSCGICNQPSHCSTVGIKRT